MVLIHRYQSSFQMLDHSRIVLGNTHKKRWRVARNQAQEKQHAGNFWPLGSTETKGNRLGFSAFKKHKKVAQNQAEEQQQAGIFWCLESTKRWRVVQKAQEKQLAGIF